MEERSTVSSRRNRFSSFERLVAIGLAILAVASPLFINWRPVNEDNNEAEFINFAAWLPLLLLMLIFAIAVSLLDTSFARFDPYWIHRAAGSSGGIIFILVVLALILKWKA